LASILSRTLLGGVCFVLVGAADAQNVPRLFGPDALDRAKSIEMQISDAERTTLRQAVDAAQVGNVSRARDLRESLTSPLGRKLVLWVMTDSSADSLTFFELDQARKDLWGWPRASRRQGAAERQLGAQGMAPQTMVDWFKGESPTTPEGAMTLASALRGVGRVDDARALIRGFWRDRVFEADQQRQMLSRFSEYLTPADHIRRADMLLYGQQGPATTDMIALLPADQQALAQARMAFRQNSSRAGLMAERLPGDLADSPGLAFERARYLRRHGEAAQALSLIRYLPKDPPGDDAASAVWVERRALIGVALAAHDYKAAYAAASNTGLPPGVDYAEVEFYAGWLALTKLNDPKAADTHFENIQKVGSSPITQGRALYWRGRAQDALGDEISAKDFYAQAAVHSTTFYGQLAAEQAGLGEFSIGKDPVPTADDKARFEGRETVQAARLLVSLGEDNLFRSLVLSIDDTLPNAEEYALLVDLARGWGQQDLSMRVVRVAAQHGYVLPERGYPLTATPTRDVGSPELALVYGIIRQESGFDPRVRSGVGARGMMQLMPSTAKHVARQLGVLYAPTRLDDPNYNIQLGSTYLGDMIDKFSGSYVMATASYNAGPGHMPNWSAICGDPRGASNDPIDFIECIPFSETRNYVMRVLEGMQVYRARLNGGHAALTLSRDLRRGGYTPGPAPQVAWNPVTTAAATTANAGLPPGTMAPIPD
jgi:soluble lytic murein transglycosylase